MRQDQHAVGVAEVALVLLHALPRHRAAELGEQRRPEQLGQRQVVTSGKSARSSSARCTSPGPVPST